MRKILFSSFLLIFLLLSAFVLTNAKPSSANEPVLLAQSSFNRSCGMTCGIGTSGTPLRCASGLMCLYPPIGGGLGRCVPPGCTWANRATCCSVLTGTPPGKPPISPVANTTAGPVPTTFAGASPTLPPTDTGVSGTPTIIPSVVVTGTPMKSDCASVAGPGVTDGRVDLIDIDQLRKELSKQVATTFCDIDKNGTVDIIDFTDFMRKDFIGI